MTRNIDELGVRGREGETFRLETWDEKKRKKRLLVTEKQKGLRKPYIGHATANYRRLIPEECSAPGQNEGILSLFYCA